MAFELNEWLVKTLTKGVQNGTATKEWAAVQLAMLEKKGIVTGADIERFEERAPDRDTVAEIATADTFTGEKLRALVGAIAVPPKPELPEKIGEKWELAYTVGHDSFAWVSVPDPDARGTEDKPVEWYAGMAVMPNAWYQYGGALYVCVKGGAPEDIDDAEYFELMSDPEDKGTIIFRNVEDGEGSDFDSEV